MIVKIKKPITPKKIQKAFAELANNKNAKKGFDAGKHSGQLKGVFGDALQYQKAVRGEWE